MSTGPAGSADRDAPTSAYAEPPPPPDDRSVRHGYRGPAAGFDAQPAPPAPPPDRSVEDDELTETLLSDDRAARGADRPDTGQLLRAILTLGLAASVVLMVFVSVFLRLPPSDFAQYISPLIGIAGFALGYWFGTDRARW
jgi:hypothetical protein